MTACGQTMRKKELQIHSQQFQSCNVAYFLRYGPANIVPHKIPTKTIIRNHHKRKANPPT